MKICVTGGSGYIGSALVQRLMVKGHDVDVIDWAIGKDVFHVREFDYDVVYHLAAVSGVQACEKEDRDFVMRMNIDACSYVAKNCREDTLLVYTSTSAIYAKSNSIYSNSKFSGELRIKEYHQKSVILRLATIYGVSPFMRRNLLVNDFVRSAVIDGYIVIRNLDDLRPFVSLIDCVHMLSIFATGKPTDNILKADYWDVFDSRLFCSKRSIANIISNLANCEIYYSLHKDKHPQDFGEITAKPLWTSGMKPISEETILPIAKHYERQYTPTFHRA